MYRGLYSNKSGGRRKNGGTMGEGRASGRATRRLSRRRGRKGHRTFGSGVENTSQGQADP